MASSAASTKATRSVSARTDRAEARYPAGPAESVSRCLYQHADMMFVTGLDRVTADRHFRLRVAPVPGGLDEQPDAYDLQREARAAFAEGRISVTTDTRERRAIVRWDDPSFAAPVVGRALTRAGYGSILL